MNGVLCFISSVAHEGTAVGVGPNYPGLEGTLDQKEALRSRSVRQDFMLAVAGASWLQ